MSEVTVTAMHRDSQPERQVTVSLTRSQGTQSHVLASEVELDSEAGPAPVGDTVTVAHWPSP